jgi:hypothetical protein
MVRIAQIAAAMGMTGIAIASGAQAQSASPVPVNLASSPVFVCNYVTAGKLCGVETFSRAGASASMFDSTGRLTFAPNNLLLYSNTFSDAAWTSVSATITPTAKADPFGGNSSWSMQSTATSGSHYRQSVKVEPDLNYVNTLYLAPGTATWARIDRYDGLGAIEAQEVRRPYAASADGFHTSWINLSTCVAGTIARGTILTVTVAAAGWCKIDQAFIPAAATIYLGFTTAIGDKGGNSGGSSIYVYGEQLSLVTYETTAPTYYPTTAAAYYGPRFGYTYNGSAWVPAGLLLEDFRTNYIRYSNDLTNAAWVLGPTMSVARDQTGVDGVVNGASSLMGGAVSATNTICQGARVNYHTRAFSAYIKRIAGSGVVNMATDATTTAGNGATWNAMAVTANWTRVSFTQKNVTDPITCFQITDNGDKIAVQYVQNENVPNEAGASTTYPISTSSSAVSRGRETLTSTHPTLLRSNAFVVETSGQEPATDMAMLGLANLQDELSIGLGEKEDNTLYSTFPFPSLSTVDTATWTLTNRAGVASGGGGYFDSGVERLPVYGPVWSAISLNGDAATIGTGAYDALTSIWWGSEPNSGKACSCFIRSWAAYSWLTPAQLSAKSVVGAAY